VREILRCDRALVWTTLLLLLVGMLTVFTASVHVAEHSFGGTYVFLKRNAFRVALGLAALGFAFAFDYRSYRRHAKTAILMIIGLLLATLFFGRTVRGMRGFILMFQPSEVAKLVLVVYLADVLARRKDELDGFVRGLLPRLGLVAGVVLLILLQPDFGSAIAVVILSLVLLFLGGARLSHIGALAAAAVPGVILVIRFVPHIAERWAVWRATFDLSLSGVDTQGAGYQIFQSLVALGSGGLWGRGIGESLQRAFIPDPYTDFAFSIWGEEVGFLGTLGLVCVFGFLFIRGMRIARRAPDLYGQILASGLTAMITIYAFINIGVATALIPTTGLPLPFISYGGSSLIINMAAIGMLLNLSKRTSPAIGSRGPSAEMAERWQARRPQAHVEEGATGEV
jgi:cell division protein FtsW